MLSSQSIIIKTKVDIRELKNAILRSAFKDTGFNIGCPVLVSIVKGDDVFNNYIYGHIFINKDTGNLSFINIKKDIEIDFPDTTDNENVKTIHRNFIILKLNHLFSHIRYDITAFLALEELIRFDYFLEYDFEENRIEASSKKLNFINNNLTMINGVEYKRKIVKNNMELLAKIAQDDPKLSSKVLVPYFGFE